MLSLVPLGACVEAGEVAAELDPSFFRCSVQPVLDTKCSMLACHGDEARPLRVYARGRLRSGFACTQLSPPLTQAELDANYESASALAGVEPSGSLLVRKPLDEHAGGFFHRGQELFGGEDVFVEPEDPDYQTLSDWVAGAEDDSGCDYPGMEAADEAEVPTDSCDRGQP